MKFPSTDYEEKSDKYHLTELGKRFAAGTKSERRDLFGQQCRKVDVFCRFIEKIDGAGEAGISNKAAAYQVLREIQLDLADATIDKLGNLLANWAEYAGIVYRSGKRCIMNEYVPQQMGLFES